MEARGSGHGKKANKTGKKVGCVKARFDEMASGAGQVGILVTLAVLFGVADCESSDEERELSSANRDSSPLKA
jgi:hypothetical protein